MGIFDVFKTKVNEATEKVSEMMDKKKGDAANDPSARTPAQTPSPAPAQTPAPAPTSAGPVPGAEAATEDRAANMVYEGGPVASTGEAAPGIGDDGTAPQEGSRGGMTQSIKDNAAKGADKAGETAKGATGNRFDEKIDSAVRQAKDKLG